MMERLLKEVFSAIETENNIKLAALLASNPELCDMREKDSGDTPLHYAVQHGKLSSISVILPPVSDNNLPGIINDQIRLLIAKNHKDETPLVLAQKQSNDIKRTLLFDSIIGDYAKYVIPRVPDVLWSILSQTAPALLDTVDDTGKTILHYAVVGMRFDMVNMIFQCKPNLFFVWDNKGQTPLTEAMHNKNKSMIEHIISLMTKKFDLEDTKGIQQELQDNDIQLLQFKAEKSVLDLQQNVLLGQKELSTVTVSDEHIKTILQGEYAKQLVPLLDKEEIKEANKKYPFSFEDRNEVLKQIEQKISQLENRQEKLRSTPESNKAAVSVLTSVLLPNNINENNNNNLYGQVKSWAALTDWRLIKLLLTAGLPWHTQDQDGKTLGFYLWQNNLASSELSANIQLSNLAPYSALKQFTDENNNTNLHWSVIKKLPQTSRVLLQSPTTNLLAVNKDAVTKKELNALQLAYEQGHHDLFQLLLYPTILAFLKSTQQTIESVEVQAANITYLIWHFSGWDKKSINSSSSLIKGSVNLKVLSEAFTIAGLNLKKVRDNYGNTILHWAIAAGLSDFENQLIDDDFDIFAKNHDEQTPFHIKLRLALQTKTSDDVLGVLQSTIKRAQSVNNNDVSTSVRLQNSITNNNKETPLLIAVEELFFATWKTENPESKFKNILSFLEQETNLNVLETITKKYTKTDNVLCELLSTLAQFYQHQYEVIQAAQRGSEPGELETAYVNYGQVLKQLETIQAAKHVVLQPIQSLLDNFLQQKKQIGVVDSKNNTPLHYLVHTSLQLKHPKAGINAKLLECEKSILYWLSVNPNDLYRKNKFHENPLEKVIQSNEPHLSSFFLNRILKYRNLIAAVKQGDFNTVRLIFQSLNPELNEHCRRAIIDQGYTLLQLAFIHHRYNIAQSLLLEAVSQDLLVQVAEGENKGKTVFTFAIKAGPKYLQLLYALRTRLILKVASNKDDAVILQRLLQIGQELPLEINPFQILDLSGENLTKEQLSNICLAVKKQPHPSFINTLRLACVGTALSELMDKQPDELKALFQSNSNLKELDLSGNDINDSKLSLLLEGYKIAGSFLRILNLSHNELTDKSMPLLMRTINNSLEILIDGNAISWYAMEIWERHLAITRFPVSEYRPFLKIPTDFATLINQLRHWLMQHPAYDIVLKQSNSELKRSRTAAFISLISELRQQLDRAEIIYTQLLETNQFKEPLTAAAQSIIHLLSEDNIEIRQKIQLALLAVTTELCSKLETIMKLNIYQEHDFSARPWIWQFYVQVKQTQTSLLLEINNRRENSPPLLTASEFQQQPFIQSVFESSFVNWMCEFQRNYNDLLRQSFVQTSSLQVGQKRENLNESSFSKLIMPHIGTFSTLKPAHHKAADMLSKLQQLKTQPEFLMALRKNFEQPQVDKAFFSIIARVITALYSRSLSLLAQQDNLPSFDRLAQDIACHIIYWIAIVDISHYTDSNKIVESMLQWLQFGPWQNNNDVLNRFSVKVPASYVIQRAGWLCSNINGLQSIWNVSYGNPNDNNNSVHYTDGLSYGVVELASKAEVRCLETILTQQLVAANLSIDNFKISSRSKEENQGISFSMQPRTVEIDPSALDTSISGKLFYQQKQKEQQNLEEQLRQSCQEIQKLNLEVSKLQLSELQQKNDIRQLQKEMQELKVQQLQTPEKNEMSNFENINQNKVLEQENLLLKEKLKMLQEHMQQLQKEMQELKVQQLQTPASLLKKESTAFQSGAPGFFKERKQPLNRNSDNNNNLSIPLSRNSDNNNNLSIPNWGEQLPSSDSDSDSDSTYLSPLPSPRSSFSNPTNEN